MNSPLIKANPYRSAGSTAIVEYLARIWPLGACRNALTNVYFNDTQLDETRTIKHAKRVDAALSNMVNSGTLSCTGSGTDRKWFLGEATQQNETLNETLNETHEPPARYVGIVAPPRQVSPMTAPYFVPKPLQALRPGAQDFMRCPSLRAGQHVPFAGGHVGVTGSKS